MADCLRRSDSGPSPIGHGPIELDRNIWTWLQRTPVAVAVVSLAVMCSYGPDKLLGALVIGPLLPGGGRHSKDVDKPRRGGLTPLAKGSPLWGGVGGG